MGLGEELLKNFFTVKPRVYTALRIVGLQSPVGYSEHCHNNRQHTHKLSVCSSRSGSTSDAQESRGAGSWHTRRLGVLRQLECGTFARTHLRKAKKRQQKMLVFCEAFTVFRE